MVAVDGSRGTRKARTGGRASAGAVPRDRRILAGVVAMVTAAVAGSLLIAPPAVAAPVSNAQGSFLTGSALGLDLAPLLSVLDARASNTGATSTVTQNTPLLAAELNNSGTVPIGGGVNLLGPGGILTLGAVNQYAQARSDGSSTAASGAVTSAGRSASAAAAGCPRPMRASTSRRSSHRACSGR